ncbi:XRE family transcriptional regulator [Streptomyces gobiensis]|uniref:XRE family transcriptional regulator n=1 Tax=Streptomyces gobiensis TaxID=2875706 RepID=UPI001E63266F|nr:XRE family transcriptional regulator [Streptomyces gobiensis]UGY91496.1 XRE family transcriptional regulator [Streptomyces gobiensis]
MGSADSTSEGIPRTLAEKIDHLFTATLAPGEKPPSYRKVAAAINESAGESVISSGYLCELRTGVKDNPTKRQLEAIADYFDVSPAFFHDDKVTALMVRQLEVMAGLGSGDISSLAPRGVRANGLSAEMLAHVQSVIEDLMANGLPEAESKSEGGGADTGSGGR